MATRVAPVSGIFDTATGKLTGLVREGSPGPVMDMRGLDEVSPLDSNAVRAQALGRRAALAYTGMWFPFNERNSSLLTDLSGTIGGNVKGGSSARWQAAPGLTFNGSNHRVECNASTSNAPQYSVARVPPQEGFTHAVRRCADLNSLVADGDMIMAWAVITHPATIASDQILAGFGMNNDPNNKGGWAFGIKAGPGKVQFWHRGRSGSATDATPLTMDGVTGKNADNTRTAIALQIMASRQAGYLEIHSYMQTLGTDGGAGQNIVGCVSPLVVPTGASGAVKGETINNPLTIGAWSDTVPFARNAPAGTFNVGSSGNFTATADFGADGPGGKFPFNQGLWLWFGPVATVPALTAKPYWVEFSTLRLGTIYSDGPGSAPINITSGAAYSVVTPNFINYFAGTMTQLGIYRMPVEYGLGMRIVRDLRDDQLAFPASMGMF